MASVQKWGERQLFV